MLAVGLVAIAACQPPGGRRGPPVLARACLHPPRRAARCPHGTLLLLPFLFLRNPKTRTLRREMTLGLPSVLGGARPRSAPEVPASHPAPARAIDAATAHWGLGLEPWGGALPKLRAGRPRRCSAIPRSDFAGSAEEGSVLGRTHPTCPGGLLTPLCLRC